MAPFSKMQKYENEAQQVGTKNQMTAKTFLNAKKNIWVATALMHIVSKLVVFCFSLKCYHDYEHMFHLTTLRPEY